MPNPDSKQMKAFTNRRYGNPEVLQLEEVPIPQPKPKEVKVKVKALSLNPAEWHIMRATIWMIRLQMGLFRPKNPVLGADLAGTVESVGAEVTAFQPGDYVMGRTDKGGIAEYACLEENKAARLPDSISAEAAAATPLAAITALIGLRDKGQIKAGQKVLINGASGGIGTYAIQLANYYGTEVTAVCSGPNAELVKSLGAAQLIDYTQEDFTQHEEQYDLILDLIGNRSAKALNRILAPEGRCILIGWSGFGKMLRFLWQGGWLSRTTSKTFSIMDAETTRKDLEFIAQLIVQGHLKPTIEKVYPFEATPAAFAHLGTRRAKGKIVIKL